MEPLSCKQAQQPALNATRPTRSRLKPFQPVVIVTRSIRIRRTGPARTGMEARRSQREWAPAQPPAMAPTCREVFPKFPATPATPIFPMPPPGVHPLNMDLPPGVPAKTLAAAVMVMICREASARSPAYSVMKTTLMTPVGLTRKNMAPLLLQKARLPAPPAAMAMICKADFRKFLVRSVTRLFLIRRIGSLPRDTAMPPWGKAGTHAAPAMAKTFWADGHRSPAQNAMRIILTLPTGILPTNTELSSSIRERPPVRHNATGRI